MNQVERLLDGLDDHPDRRADLVPAITRLLARGRSTSPAGRALYRRLCRKYSDLVTSSPQPV
ncbi:hypothetical protein D5S17_03885 [Pseudonocardiaceae bacterium YIM PH 21723]|nr:hypothetical protein D5S17_03885 [Pseudonocardiaceae bacterium YIM PH 21723]